MDFLVKIVYVYHLVGKSVLVKIITIKLHHKSILIQLQQILSWTCCVFLSSLNNTFFSVLVIIFSNKSFFFFQLYEYIFLSCHELFFSGTSNYFVNVYEELFLWLGRELFFAVSRIYFSVYNALRALHLKWTGSSLSPPWATILKTLQVEECFQRECQGETLSGKETKEVFIFLTKSVRS